MSRTVERKDRVVVRFAGDSGDGMQLTGSRFTDATAVVGNDLATLPGLPRRDPRAGRHAARRLRVPDPLRHRATSSRPGDNPNVLVAMNPAALITNVGTLEKGGTVLVNEDAFTKHNLRKAGYEANPLEDGSLDDYQLFRVPMTSMTVRATEEIEEITSRDAARSKNLFALGLVSWLYGRPTEPTIEWIEKKFADAPPVKDANLAAFRAGYNFGETAELFAVNYEVDAAPAEPGNYRNINGTTALSLRPDRGQREERPAAVLRQLPDHPGLGAAAQPLAPQAVRRAHRAGRGRDRRRRHGAGRRVRRATSGVTATSGPGMDLKAETVSLAVAMELPMVIVDVQRAGPSTGLPTKTEQGDLLMAMYGRHGESPLPVVAAATPGECFDAAVEAVRIAVKYRTPVVLLSDTFLSNSSEPWRLPDVDALPDIDPAFATEPNHARRLPALRARREPGPPVGGARHPRPAPPHRRPGEGARHRQHLLRPREPRAHDPPARRAHRADRRATSRSSR